MQTTATGATLYVETEESRERWAKIRAEKQAEYAAAGLVVERPKPTRNERRMQLLMQGPAGDDYTVHTAEEREAWERHIEATLEAEGYGPPATSTSIDERLRHVVEVAQRRGLTVRRCRIAGGYIVSASTIEGATFTVNGRGCSCPGYGRNGICSHIGAVVVFETERPMPSPTRRNVIRIPNMMEARHAA